MAVSVRKNYHFKDWYPQKISGYGPDLVKYCAGNVYEYEKLTKPPKNDNMAEIIETESSQDELASDNHFLLYESPKMKLNLTLESTGISPINIHGVAQHGRASNANGKLKKVLNVYKENISTAYNVFDIEIE